METPKRKVQKNIMNISVTAEKIIEAVKKAPKIEKGYMAHGEPHYYEVIDWDVLELAIQQILNEGKSTATKSED